MIVYEPVWISTDEHIEKLYEIYKYTSISEKIFVKYKLPPNFPYIQSYWWLIPSKKIPVVAIASGIGKIGKNKFLFQSKPFNIPGSTTKNLLDLEFDISRDELIRVARAKAESPVFRYYSIPFTRVQTQRTGLLSNFLVCVGGIGPSMKKINAQSDELFQSLNNLISNKGNQDVTA